MTANLAIAEIRTHQALQLSASKRSNRPIAPTGSIAGPPSKERGKCLARRLVRTGAAQITTSGVLRHWLNVLTRKGLEDGSSARTTSSLWPASCVMSSSSEPSRQITRTKRLSSKTGVRCWRTIIFGTESATPTCNREDVPLAPGELRSKARHPTKRFLRRTPEPFVQSPPGLTYESNA
jgi:hypothetical protein